MTILCSFAAGQPISEMTLALLLNCASFLPSLVFKFCSTFIRDVVCKFFYLSPCGRGRRGATGEGKISNDFLYPSPAPSERPLPQGERGKKFSLCLYQGNFPPQINTEEGFSPFRKPPWPQTNPFSFLKIPA